MKIKTKTQNDIQHKMMCRLLSPYIQDLLIHNILPINLRYVMTFQKKVQKSIIKHNREKNYHLNILLNRNCTNKQIYKINNVKCI